MGQCSPNGAYCPISPFSLRRGVGSLHPGFRLPSLDRSRASRSASVLPVEGRLWRRYRDFERARAGLVLRGLTELSGRPHTRRPAFLALLAKGAIIGVVVGGLLAWVTALAGYAEWTLVVFEFIALAAMAVLPVGLGIRAVTHATWRSVQGRQAGATPEELQLASQLVIPLGSGAIAAWVVLVLARWLDTGEWLFL
jgi:hypothetical protein